MKNINKNKYYDCYNRIINSRKSLNRRKYPKTNKNYILYERHHIIPKSLGGSNDDNNLILLTPKEHYIVHLLLTKFTNGSDLSKMIQALWYISNKYKIGNSRLYESLKIKRSKILSLENKGSGNPMFGRKHSQETKDKISKVHKGKTISQRHKNSISGENNIHYSKGPMLGKKHTIETKKKIGEASSLRIGHKSSKFIGYYISPFGKFEARSDISKVSANISPKTLSNWCKNCDKVITKSNYNRSQFLQSLSDNPIGKSFRDIGFWFDSK